mmetsp:Transcript_12347/g.21861  ORF Transcript_12347/g.21861 Transcript_12347/m.21861 type:complete len:288 (+) Transcript_12347:231-1094(+)
MAEWPPMEQEEKLAVLLKATEKLLKKAEKTHNPDKLHGVLKDISTKLKESKALLKDFEREARTDGMPAPLLAERKKTIADELNTYINKKKEIGLLATKDELFTGAIPQAEEIAQDQMTTQQLMQRGRRDLADTDATLGRAERLVEDTLQVGTSAAVGLQDQTHQLNKIVDDLNDIEFNVKKASKVISDITRGLLTDKCIGFLLFAAVAGVIVIIVLKIVKPNQKKITDTISTISNNTGFSNLTDSLKNQASAAAGRRMLRTQIAHFLEMADLQSVATIFRDTDGAEQ